MHWPRYIRLSLIFPASASVAPAVRAFRARSEPFELLVEHLFQEKALHAPAKSTTVIVLPLHGPFVALFRFFTSMAKNP